MNDQIIRCPHCRLSIAIVGQLERTSFSCTRKAAILFNVPEADIVGGIRQRRVSKARHHAWMLMRDSGFSFAEIGRAFGGYDHSSIQYGVRKARQSA